MASFTFRRFTVGAAIAIAVLAMTGCGLKGPLVLPGKDAKSHHGGRSSTGAATNSNAAPLGTGSTPTTPNTATPAATSPNTAPAPSTNPVTPPAPQPLKNSSGAGEGNTTGQGPTPAALPASPPSQN